MAHTKPDLFTNYFSTSQLLVSRSHTDTCSCLSYTHSSLAWPGPAPPREAIPTVLW